jgi:small nuclear ribonucleoprotein (snRNP)-like protein
MDNQEATAYVSQFIGQPLRIHTSDGRVFGGQMKCTDKVCMHSFPACFQTRTRTPRNSARTLGALQIPCHLVVGTFTSKPR